MSRRYTVTSRDDARVAGEVDHLQGSLDLDELHDSFIDEDDGNQRGERLLSEAGNETNERASVGDHHYEEDTGCPHIDLEMGSLVEKL